MKWIYQNCSNKTLVLDWYKQVYVVEKDWFKGKGTVGASSDKMVGEGIS